MYGDVLDLNHLRATVVNHNITWIVHYAALLSAIGEQNPLKALQVSRHKPRPFASHVIQIHPMPAPAFDTSIHSAWGLWVSQCPGSVQRIQIEAVLSKHHRGIWPHLPQEPHPRPYHHASQNHIWSYKSPHGAAGRGSHGNGMIRGLSYVLLLAVLPSKVWCRFSISQVPRSSVSRHAPWRRDHW